MIKPAELQTFLYLDGFGSFTYQKVNRTERSYLTFRHHAIGKFTWPVSLHGVKYTTKNKCVKLFSILLFYYLICYEGLQ